MATYKSTAPAVAARSGFGLGVGLMGAGLLGARSGIALLKMDFDLLMAGPAAGELRSLRKGVGSDDRQFRAERPDLEPGAH